jgi:hypothetical protein
MKLGTRTEIILFVVILCFLFGQYYGLKSSYYSIYPTVSLPSGEQIIKGNKINYNKYLIEAYSDSGEVVNVPMEKLLEFMPQIYRIRVINNHFGLPTSDSASNSLHSNPPKITTGKQWMVQKLKSITSLSHIEYLKVTKTNISKKLDSSGNVLDRYQDTSGYRISLENSLTNE